MEDYVKIPAWIIYRSALSPCEIYSFGSAGFELILVFDQPIPKLQIKRMMGRGVEWLYLEKNSESLYLSYLEKFSKDPSFSNWVEDLLKTGRPDLLKFPNELSLPDDLSTRIANDYALFESRQREESQIQEVVGEQLETESTELFLVRSLSRFKEELIIVRDSGTYDLKTQRRLLGHLKLLQKQTKDSGASGVLCDRLKTLSDFVEDLSETGDWQSAITEVFDEVSAVELTLSQPDSIVDTGVVADSDELNELYAYKNKLEEENRALLEDAQKWRNHVAEVEEERDRLTKELDSVNKQYKRLYADHKELTEKLQSGPFAEAEKKVSSLESKVKGLREVGIQQKLELGKTSTQNQELARALRLKENQLKQLLKKVEDLQKRKAS